MNSESLFSALTYISILSGIIPLTACVHRFKTLNKELRVLFLYIVLSLLTEGVSFILAKSNIQNYISQNIFTVLECFCITYIYYYRFETSKARKAILFLFIFFVLGAITLLLLKGGYDKADNILTSYESCFFIALSVLYFLKEVRESNIQRLKNDKYFYWINAAFLIYFSTAFFLFLFNDYIEKLDLQLYYLIYGLHLVVNIGYNLLLTIGVWKIKQTS